MKKVLLILLLSLNNYGFNELLSKIHGSTLRDFIFSFFVKKENTDFSMLQTWNNTNTIPDLLQGVPFSENNFLNDEAQIKEYKEKFINYNIEKFNNDFNSFLHISHPNFTAKEIEECVCLEILHQFIGLLKKQNIHSHYYLNDLKKQDGNHEITVLGSVYDALIEDFKKATSPSWSISSAEKRLMNIQQQILSSSEPDIGKISDILQCAQNLDNNIRIADLESFFKFSNILERLRYIYAFRRCLENKTYSRFFTVPPR